MSRVRRTIRSPVAKVQRELERAEALDRRQNELMTIVSHDLRNPLAAVLLGASTLLRRPDLTEAQRREHLEVMYRAAARANQLVLDLLDAARIADGHLVLSRERICVRNVLAEAVEQMAQLAAEREVSCRSTAQEELPLVHADRERVLQVLGNLISNAIRFCRPGGSVALSASLGGGEVRCAVSDDGSGIPAADLPHIFERYFQGKPESAESRGAGLGLTIARGIVEAHGGRIWVESREGHGSTFFFTLPLAPAGPRHTP